MTKNEDRINKLFKELVPDTGKADSLAGELVRAMSRIGYRFYNDGDQLGIGYGKETCNPAGRFLGAKGNDKIAKLTADAWAVYSEEAYKKVWTSFAERLPTMLSRTQTLETSRPKICGTSRMRKKTRMTAGMKRKMTGAKRKITRTKKTTKPEKHMGLAGNGSPFLLL
jgi:hypothetical protein|nr:MAG TPA: hypothetical protein [Caudoviricetes sp.]